MENQNSENRHWTMRDTAILISGISAVLVFYGALFFGVNYVRGLQPTRAYLKDINQDGVADIIVRTRKKADHIFIAQSDGLYKPLEEITAEKKDSLAAEVQRKKHNVENLEKTIGGQERFVQSQEDSLYARAKEIH